jgi:hypothetical protein
MLFKGDKAKATDFLSGQYVALLARVDFDYDF